MKISNNKFSYKIQNRQISLNTIFLFLFIISAILTITLLIKKSSSAPQEKIYQPATPYAGRQLPDNYR